MNEEQLNKPAREIVSKIRYQRRGTTKDENIAFVVDILKQVRTKDKGRLLGFIEIKLQAEERNPFFSQTDLLHQLKEHITKIYD